MKNRLVQKSKRLLSNIVATAIAASMLPTLPAVAETGEKYPYTLFAASSEEGAITVNAGNFCVNGNVATNGTIVSSGNMNINGTKTENANESMIFIFDKIDSQYFSTNNVDEFTEDYTLEEINININTPTEVMGETTLTGNININTALKSLEDVNLYGEVKNTNDSVIFSKYGDIIIDSQNVNLNGLVYAPFGDVEVTAQNLNLNNVVIIADTITFNCPNVNANYSGNAAELVGTVSEVFELTSEGLEHLEDLNNNSLPDFFEEDDNWYLLNDSNSDGCPNLIQDFLESNDLTLDSDSDNVPDWYETLVGTNVDASDSDNDGLPDGYEIYATKTNPLKNDSNNNGVADSNEDFDGDCLRNIDEYCYMSEPYHVDSDFDGTDDYNEIFTYNTDPIEYDTDSDGLSDGLEVNYNMNPLIQDTLDDGVLDGDRVFTVVETGWDYAKEDTIKPIIEIELTGTQIDTLSISKVDNDDLFLNSNIPGYLGNAYEFNVDGVFDSATLTFEISAECFNNPNFIPAIYYWDEAKQCLLELDNQSINGNSVSAPIEHFSKYIVIAKNIYEETLFECEILPPTDLEMQRRIFDVALVLDESGSISRTDYSLMKNLASELVNGLENEDRVAVFTFDHTITKHTSFINKSDAVTILRNIGQSSGNTAIYDAINVGTNEFASNSSDNATKIMILLTDGLDNSSYTSSNSVAQAAKDNNVIIYTVGVGSVNSNVLTSISNATGGAYYNAADFSQLEGVFDKLQVDVDLYRDSDCDGISDYHEKKIAAGEMKLGTGATLNNFSSLNYLNPDSDNDGLSDGQEFKVESQYIKGSSVYYCYMTSVPCLDDSDGDGYLDYEDTNPLIWDVSDRDLAIASAISYSFIPKGSELDNLSEYWNSELNNRLFDLAYVEELKGWKVRDTWYALGGLQILVLQNGNNTIVAHRGTEPGGGDAWELAVDWFNNAVTYILGMSTQTPVAKRFMESTMKSNPGSNFYVTGHSLGGHLTYNAAAQGISYKSSAIKAIVTFNGLGLTFGGFGLGDVWDEWQLNKKLSVIRNYMVEGDPVSKGFLGATTVHYGTSYTYKKDKNAPDEHSLYTFLSILEPIKRGEKVLI